MPLPEPLHLPRQSPQGDTSFQGETPWSPASPDPSPDGEAVPSPAARRRRARRTATSPRADLLDVSGRLSPRDKVLVLLLDAHHTLTTTQITAILFDSRATASSRLYRLRSTGLLDRFIPLRAAGRLDTHWVLGPLGAHWAAHHQGRTPPTARAARERREAIAASSHLEHTDGANQVFIDLLTTTRRHPGTRLARWWSPARTAAALGQRVHPDGHGVWEEPADRHTQPHTEKHPGQHTGLQPGRSRQVGFWLEYDRGSETLDRVRNKIEPYRRLRRDGGPDYPLLLWLPNPTRETNLHRKLNGEAAHLGITLATTTATAVASTPDGITGPVWKIAGNGRRRHRLADLPSRPGTAGPYHPGPPNPMDAPLYLLEKDPTQS